MNRAPDREFETVFVKAQDGLNLHVRVWGAPHTSALPIVCLPGLTRTTADFDDVGRLLAWNGEKPRRILALDYRGRGASDYDTDPKNYNVLVELADVIAVVTALNASPAIYIGTSRGGILTMLLAATQPAMIAGAILNDIGPVIEMEGLLRIKGYVGKMPEPKTFEEGASILRRIFGEQFPRLTDDDWLMAARNAWRKTDGARLVPTYDVRLSETLNDIDPTKVPVDLWPQFDALAQVPLMVIRGVNSDLLSVGTLQRMQDRRPDMQSVQVSDQGHPPLLGGSELVSRILSFVDAIERDRNGDLCSQPSAR